MLKKSLFLGAAALALLVLVVLGGCSNPASENDSAPQFSPDGLVIDAAVNTVADFQAILDDPEIRVILFDLNGSDKQFTVAGLAIPPEKTIYLVNNGYDPDAVDPFSTVNSLSPTGISGLNIRGTVIVGRGVALVATDTTPISLWSTGSVQVQDDGVLVTDQRLNVTNYTDQGVERVSVLGTNVRFLAGSTLVIDDEEDLTFDEIYQLLAILTPGTLPARLAGPTGTSNLVLSKSNLKPSEFAELRQLSPGQSLSVTSIVSETAESITIPAGLSITTAAGDVLTGVTQLTVNGTFIAASAAGKADGIGFTVESGGSLTVGTITKLKASSVAAGGSFTGRIAEFLDANAVLSAAAGARINGYLLTAASTIKTPNPAGGGSTTIAGATPVTPTTPLLIPPDSNVEFTGGVTVEAGATFTIAENAEVEIADGAFSLAGTLDLPGSLTIGDSADAPTITGTVNIQDGGSLTLGSGTPTGDLKGTIEIRAGGVLRDLKAGGGSLWDTESTGSFVFKAGSEGYRGSGTTPIIGHGDDTTAAIALVTGALTLKTTGYELDGTATLQSAFPIFATETLDIRSNSTLTISGTTVALTILGKATIAGTIVGSNSGTQTIVVGNVADTAVTISGTSNFYANDGTTVQTTLVKGKTYTWTVDLDTATAGNQSGWKSN
ncbi:hypothetical protein LQZ21_10345 [Treponema sp. TIM-1]|uniref:hypothetical protein n=1 Tax=Treponema sp. TIM-1 TaxID=2898417 RepID=UPI003980BAB9